MCGVIRVIFLTRSAANDYHPEFFLRRVEYVGFYVPLGLKISHFWDETDVSWTVRSMRNDLVGLSHARIWPFFHYLEPCKNKRRFLFLITSLRTQHKMSKYDQFQQSCQYHNDATSCDYFAGRFLDLVRACCIKHPNKVSSYGTGCTQLVS